MSEDKKKAKKEILGELESIKTLLDGQATEEDEFEDAPLLTEAIDQAISNPASSSVSTMPTSEPHNSSPSNSTLNIFSMDDDLETEAPLVDLKVGHEDGSQSTRTGTENIESLYSDIYRSLHEKAENNEALEAEEKPEDPSLINLEFQNIPTLDTVIDENDTSDLQTAAEEDLIEEHSVEESSISAQEDPVKEEYEQDSFEIDAAVESLAEIIIEEQAEVATEDNSELADTENSLVALATEDSTDSNSLFEQQPVGRENVTQEHGKPEPLQGQNSAGNFEEKDTATEATVFEDQKSLFDDIDEGKTTPQARSTVTETGNIAHQQATQKAVELSKKTENPFLPKHIRDRLQSARIQPDSFDTFPQTHNTQADSALTQDHDANSFVAEPRSKPTGLTVEEQLINDLVRTYLPIIEADLRDKLLELVKSKSKDTT